MLASWRALARAWLGLGLGLGLGRTRAGAGVGVGVGLGLGFAATGTRQVVVSCALLDSRLRQRWAENERSDAERQQGERAAA